MWSLESEFKGGSDQWADAMVLVSPLALES
jgi:hypothetical protein